ncbi:MAG: ATP-binding protein [Sandaracinaceae bacterium]|nr:ATP-binding protein [Sandaracinaceae bacterium]
MDHNAEAIRDAIQTAQDVAALAAEQGEGQFLDYKAAPPPKDRKEPRRQWKDSIAECVCAFANASGGVLVLGVADTRRELSPFPDARTLSEELTRHLATQIEPYPRGVEIATISSDTDGSSFLRVYVPESLEAPHMVGGRFLRRRGDESFPMTRSEIADMFGRRARPAFRFALAGCKTSDSFPRFMLRLVLVNTGSGSAVAPAVEINAESGEKFSRDPVHPWERCAGSHGRMLRTLITLHPNQRELLSIFEWRDRPGPIPPRPIAVTIYCSDNPPQAVPLEVPESFVNRLRETPGEWLDLEP